MDSKKNEVHSINYLNFRHISLDSKQDAAKSLDYIPKYEVWLFYTKTDNSFYATHPIT